MIPIRLHPYNFLSYGETPEPLDFTGIRLACLSGPNGHGKSALLDAITWALWGRARVNTADDLVRAGAREMQVDFEFALEGRRLRVVRKRMRGRTGQSDLQLMEWSEWSEPPGWRSLTEGGVQQTQAAIERLLRMDYDTFVNSAFILQNRADEFARKTPAERKRILGEILGLAVYEELESRARERFRQATSERDSLDREIARLEAEVAREPELQAEVERCRAEADAAQLAVQRGRAAREVCARAKAELDGKRTLRDEIARQLVTVEQECLQFQRQTERVRRQIEAGEALIAKEPDLRAQVAALDRVRADLAEERRKLEALQRLTERRHQIEAAMMARRSELERQLATAQQVVRELAGRVRLIPTLATEEARLREAVTAVAAEEARLSELRDRAAALRETLAALAQRRRLLEQQRAEIHERWELLKRADARCPVCDGDLPSEKRLRLGREVRNQRDALDRELQQLGEEQTAHESDQRRVQGEVALIEAKLRGAEALRHRLAQAEQKLGDLRDAERDLPAAEERVRVLEAALAAGDYAPEERAQLRAIETQIAETAYDAGLVAALEQRERELAAAEAELHQLEATRKGLAAARERLAEIVAMLADRRARLPELRTRVAELDRDLTRLPAVEAELRRLDTELDRLEAAATAASQALSRAEAELDRCRQLRPVLKDRLAARDAAARCAAIHQELVRAFGKNGIQALIIENAVPEIQEEANAILARMTENEMRVALELTRQRRDQSLADTLDIRISDHHGERRYELFSGGEAFRINFALRIALSKLLARRAQAQLQTLVIDEGFGSQDSEGRQRLLDAIAAVQDDFQLILVITHLDELKEAFPVRIEVTKTEAGSRYATL